MSQASKTKLLDFSDLIVDSWRDPGYRFEAKKEDITIALTGLLHHSGISRSELASRLNWKRSRVTRALSGKENLTLKTLYEIISAAGYDFDLALRTVGQQRHVQPWERQAVGSREPHCEVTTQMFAPLRLRSQRTQEGPSPTRDWEEIVPRQEKSVVKRVRVSKVDQYAPIADAA